MNRIIRIAVAALSPVAVSGLTACEPGDVVRIAQCLNAGETSVNGE